jgi:hypothetical protein
MQFGPGIFLWAKGKEMLAQRRERSMKTGVIVYVVGTGGRDDQIDFEEAAQSLHLEADRVEVVASQYTDFDIMYAWWRLAAKGMKRIVCTLAEVGNHSTLKLTGRELVLCSG